MALRDGIYYYYFVLCFDNTYIRLCFLQLKSLLRDVLDQVAEQDHHSKKHRERIYNDEVYFTSSKPPENIPEWANNDTYYETDETNELNFDIDNFDNEIDDDYMTELFYNTIQPEDFDEVGESSTMASARINETPLDVDEDMELSDVSQYIFLYFLLSYYYYLYITLNIRKEFPIKKEKGNPPAKWRGNIIANSS